MMHLLSSFFVSDKFMLLIFITVQLKCPLPLPLTLMPHPRFFGSLSVCSSWPFVPSISPTCSRLLFFPSHLFVRPPLLIKACVFCKFFNLRPSPACQFICSPLLDHSHVAVWFFLLNCCRPSLCMMWVSASSVHLFGSFTSSWPSLLYVTSFIFVHHIIYGDWWPFHYSLLALTSPFCYTPMSFTIVLFPIILIDPFIPSFISMALLNNFLF